MKKIQLILLVSVSFMFTACSSILYKDGYYSGKEPIKDDFGLVIASATADKYFGNTLITYIRLENIDTNEKVDLENRICKIKKNSLGIGPIAKMIIGDDPIVDQIDIKDRCGSLLVAEIKAGTYELTKITIASTNNAKGEFASWARFKPLTKKVVKIKNKELVYIGNLDTEIKDMNFAYEIIGASVSMSDKYEYDSKIFKRDYKILKKLPIKNNSITFNKK